jgi:hypothetical protein
MATPMTDLTAVLPRLLPHAIAWVQTQETAILTTGRALTDVESRLAVAVGVQNPDRVRIQIVTQIPAPAHPELRAIASQTGLIGPHTGGITLGYGIYIREGHVTSRLVSHELRHVHQYETAGSIAAFLGMYLEQIASVGYERAPLELDATRHERDAP